MKKMEGKVLFSVFLAILSIIINIPIASADRKGVIPDPKYVTGTNDSNINGKYEFDEIYNERISWAKGDYTIRWNSVSMTNAWVIENKSNSNQYYSNETDICDPPQTGWGCEANAALPCTQPVVSSKNLPDR
mgnify:CR=1 FL=1